MPGLVGGFGNSTNLLKIFINSNQEWNNPINNLTRQKSSLNSLVNSNLGSYLAGLIEGDGTFAIHDVKSTTKKYKPMIIVVFKKADLPLAQYLKNITNCGKVFIKSDRGYILWQIQDIAGIFNIVNIINGNMRTPKIEALERTIN
jgi:hypothetical protein